MKTIGKGNSAETDLFSTLLFSIKRKVPEGEMSLSLDWFFLFEREQTPENLFIIESIAKAVKFQLCRSEFPISKKQPENSTPLLASSLECENEKYKRVV